MFVGLLVCLIRQWDTKGEAVDSEHGDMMSEFDMSCVYQINHALEDWWANEH